jgi:hypothetical protein
VTGARKRPPPPPSTPPSSTQVLGPSIVRDPDIVVQTRKDANKKKQLAAQLPDEVWAELGDHHDRHPNASNNARAAWLKGQPQTKQLVAHLKYRSLADKIGAELRSAVFTVAIITAMAMVVLRK